MATPWTYVNGGQSKAASARSSGGASLTVTAGDGAKFGSPTTAAPLKLAVWRSGSFVTVLKATGVSGDVLTIDGTADAATDAAVNVGDDLAASATKGDFDGLWTALDSKASAGVASVYDMRYALAKGVDLAVGTNLTGNGNVATCGGTGLMVKVIAKTNGSGGGFTLDVRKNGTSIFTTLPAVAASSTTVHTFTPTTTTFAEDDEFTVDCTAAGSGIRDVLVIITGRTAVQ